MRLVLLRGAATLAVLLLLVLPTRAADRGVYANSGDKLTASISEPGDEDPFTMDLAAGGFLSVSIKTKTTALTAKLYRPDGAEVAMGAQLSGSGTGKLALKKFQVPAGQTGTWNFVVSSTSGVVGNYVLAQKYKPPKGFKRKGENVPTGQVVTYDFPGADGALVSIKLKEAAGGPLASIRLLDPDGVEVPGSAAALIRKKTSVSMKSFRLGQGFGDYSLELTGAAGGAVTADVSAKVKFAKPVKRAATLPAEATVEGISIASLRQEDVGLTFNLTGTNLRDGSTAVFSGEGMTVTAVVLNNSTSAQVTVSVAADAAYGLRDLTWVPPIRDGEPVTLDDALTVLAPDPTLSGASPATVAQGAGGVVVTLTGTGFRANGAISMSAATGVSLSNPLMDSATQLRVTVTATNSLSTHLGALDLTFTQAGAGGGAEVTLEDAVAIHAPTPTVSLASPDTVKQGASGLLVTVTGTNFRTGGSLSVSGSGLSLGSTTVLSATSARVSVTASAGATVGDRDVTFTQPAAGGSGQGTGPDVLTVHHPDPSISGVDPSAVERSATGTFTLSGTGFRSGGVVTTDSAGVTLSNSTYVNAGEFTVDYDVAGGAALGRYDLTYTQPAAGGGAGVTASDLYSVSLAPPTLTDLSPSTLDAGAGGTEFTLTGTNFDANGTVTVEGVGFNVSGFTLDSSTQVRVTISATLSSSLGALGVTYTQPMSGGGASDTLESSLTVSAPTPTVSSIDPTEMAQQDQNKLLTVTGSDFHTDGTISISGTGLTVGSTTVLSATSATVNVTVAAGASTSTRDITFTQPAAGGGASDTLEDGLEITPPTVQLTSVSPSRVRPGDTRVTCVLAGSGYDSGTSVSFSGSGITVHGTTYDSTSQLTIVISVASNAALGSRTVTIDPAGDSSKDFASKFYVAPADPVVTGFSHPALARGATSISVTVEGTNFRSGAVLTASGTGVTFASVSVVSDVKITASATVTAGAAIGLRDLSVAHSTSEGGRSGTLDDACRIVVASPTVSSANPSAIGVTGSGGATRVTPIQITGTNFSGGATVTVLRSAGSGITVGTPTVVSNTEIRVDLTVTGAASTGTWDVKVTNPGSGGNSGTTGDGKLTLNAASTRAVNRVLPNAGSTYGGERVTIHGAGFAAGDVVDFGAQRAYGTQVVDQNTIVTTVPQPATTSSTAVTTVNVKVTATGGGNATLTNGYSYAKDEMNFYVVTREFPAQSATGVPYSLVSACVKFSGPVKTSTAVYGNTPSSKVTWWESGGFYVASGALGWGPQDRWMVYTRTGGGNLPINNVGEYILNIPNAITSIGGHAFYLDLVSSNTADQRSFKVAATTDTTAPTVTITSVPNLTNPHTTTKLTFAFSEEMDPRLVTASSFTLKQGGSTTVNVHLEISDNLKTVTMIPETELTASTSYTAAVTSAAKDLHGNSPTGTLTKTFTTGSGVDTTSPAIDAVILEDLPSTIDGSGTYVNSGGTGGNAFDIYLDRSGFKLRVEYSDHGGAGIDPTTFSAKCSVAVGANSASAELGSNFTVTQTYAEWRIPSTSLVTAGDNVTFTFLVKDLASSPNTSSTKVITVDVIARSSTAASAWGGDLDPLSTRQTWVVRGDLDHYTATFATQTGPPAKQGATTTLTGNGRKDLDETLQLVGLHSTSMTGAAKATTNGADVGTNAIVRRLLLERLRELLRERYEIDADGTRDGQSVNIEFLLSGEQGSLSSLPSLSTVQSAGQDSGKSFSEMSFAATYGPEAGAYTASTTNGRAYTDDRNLGEDANINNDGNVGVFLLSMLKREVNTRWDDFQGNATHPFFKSVSAKFVAIHGGTPVGEDASDDDVLAGSFDRSTSGNATHNARYDAIMDAIEQVALMGSSTGAHEMAHSLGAVPDGAPKTGLFGGAHASNTFTDSASGNTSRHLKFTDMNNIMPAGSSYLDKSRTGTEFQRFNPLFLGYLRQRILYDEGK